MTPEEQTFISALRFRMKPGSDNEPTLDEQRRAIQILRENRTKAAAANAASNASRPRKSTAKAAPTAAAVADALADLDAM
jgi:hypothetical protein